GGLVENISYENITMTNVTPAITLTCLYQNNSASDAKQASGTQASTGEKIPVYRNIRITNLTATCPKAAGIINGLPESCISNVVFENVTITADKGFQIRNAKGIQFKNSTVTIKKGPAFVGENADVAGLPAGE